MRFSLLFFVIVVSLATVCRAQENGIPEIIAKGFDDYQKFGTQSAVDTWLTGSPMEGADKDQAQAKMSRAESGYGKIIGFEPIRVVKLSPSTRRVYVCVKYDKGVAWMFFDCYRPASAWIVVRFDYSARADEILPANIAGGQ